MYWFLVAAAVIFFCGEAPQTAHERFDRIACTRLTQPEKW